MVLGTAVNIKAYPGERAVTVSVSQGKVSVKQNEDILAILTEGQQVKIDNTGERVVKKNIVVSEIGVWQQGDIIYDDENFADIIASLERIYNVHIVISNKEVQNLRISTSFKKNIGISQALLNLCKLAGTQLHSGNQQYEIL